MVERVVLIGFMCSGKSAVGRLLAARLGWEFIDFDEIIERTQSRRIADIFRNEGEPYFRSLEAELTRRVAERRSVVLAPGGGWVTQPELVDMLRRNALIVWLRVQPDTVYQRHLQQKNVLRPLLDSSETLDTVRLLLAARTPLYQQADAAVDTDGRAPEEIAAEIAAMIDR